MNTPTKPVEQKARELLAAIYDAIGCPNSAKAILAGDLHTNGQDDAIRAIIAALNTDEERIRREAFEEAAKVADRYAPGIGGSSLWTDATKRIAERIRALSTPSKEVGR
jgi:hypothetical protein